MRLLACSILLALGACSGQEAKEKSLAQCQLDVLGSKGTTFRKNYSGDEYNPSEKDGSYREFMLTCMQAKGYEFASPLDDRGDVNKACWIEDKKGILPDAWVDAASCYE